MFLVNGKPATREQAWNFIKTHLPLLADLMIKEKEVMREFKVKIMLKEK